MDNQIQKKSQPNNSTTALISSIRANDELGVFQIIHEYKENGVVAMDKVLAIPPESRIPELVKSIGYKEIHALISARLTEFVNSYNVIRPMTGSQCVSCAAAIIDSSNEDQLALEDLLLFFDGAQRGLYGRVLDHLDQHVIFELFEVYRQQRHDAHMDIKDQREAQFKAGNNNNRSIDDTNDLKDSAFHNELMKYNAKHK